MGDKSTDVDVIKRDARLFAALEDFMESEYCAENLHFYFDKGNVETLYDKYLAPKAKESITISHKLTQRIADLAGKFKDKKWQQLIEDLRADVKKTMAVGPVHDFYNSSNYRDYVKSKMGDFRKAARLLGIKNVKLLEEGMLAVAMGDRKSGEVLLHKLAKLEHIREENEAVRGWLANYGFA